jgi:TetR/AcrR family transcriptional regulator, cholesterol catabolism regulator
MNRLETSVRRGVSDSERARELQLAAAELFFTKGYEATTIREIARALGIKSASIYYHWENKEEILFDLIYSAMEQLVAGVRTVLDEEQRPDRQLAGCVVHHVVIHALRPKETTLGETELRSLTGKRRRHVLQMRDHYENLVLGVLEAGVRDGLFRALDSKLSTYAIISQCTNVGIWYREGGRLRLDEIAAVYANLALRIVGGPEAEQATVSRLAAAARAFHEDWR